MNPLQALRKYDGRVVAFDPARLSQSIASAALDAGERTSREGAAALGLELAVAAASFLAKERPAPPSSADLREMTLRLLRETGHERTAEAYAEHAREAASLLWRLRLTDGASATGAEGAPWDRRRLIESLRASGVARDPAGEIGREVERRLLALNQERITAALVHALAEMELSARGFDARPYVARRVSASFAGLAPRFDRQAASERPLPNSGPALEAFWLQAVHSREVAVAAQGNGLGLEPYPHTPEDCGEAAGRAALLDPLQASAWPAELERILRGQNDEAPGAARRVLGLRADDPVRLTGWARHLAGAAVPETGSGPRAKGGASGELCFHFRWPAAGAPASPPARAPLITLNVGGVLSREALRDPVKVNRRLAQLAMLAALAHREREEYWGASAVRGRELPIAAAGLWNAAAWLTGEPFERPAFGPPQREAAAHLAVALHGAVSTLRHETGMQVTLVSEAPAAGAAALWRRDREHFARDGLHVDPSGCYGLGLDLKVSAGQPDLGERIDFLRQVATLFDEPPAACVEAPLGLEPDPAVWREFLTALSRTGIPCARVTPGGSGRGLRLLTRMVLRHLEGFPLFKEGA